MSDHDTLYVNTFAEGAEVGEPVKITPDNLKLIARAWKKDNTIAHYRLFGEETVGKGDSQKKFLYGIVGSAKVMLPIDPEFSILTGDRVKNLLDHRIAAMIEDFDFRDEVNPVLILNRKRALERMQRINEKRLAPNQTAYAVVQVEDLNGYWMNVGGKAAYMPKGMYDWVYDAKPSIGEGFNVKILPTNSYDNPTVSRKALLENPMVKAKGLIKQGSLVRIKITHIFNGVYKGDIAPGVQISFSAMNMHRILSIGDKVTVKVLGNDDKEFYGIVDSAA